MVDGGDAGPHAPTGLPVVLRSTDVDVRGIFRAVVTMSPLAMVLTDPHQADFPVIFCNRAFSRLTGFGEAEIIGRNCRLLQGRETDPEAVRVLRDAIVAGQEAQVELWNYRKDGTRFWNSMFVGPVFDGDGRLLYYFGSQADATARREMDEVKARTQRMDTLGSMAAGIAHEVNNLMTVVVGNVERLRPDNPGQKPAERLGRIDWAARATGKLTQQMLSFAGRQDLREDVVDLNDVLRGLDRLLTQVTASRVSLALELHPEALLAKVDVGQLELALINLVRNASDASPDGSGIVVSTAFEAEGAASVAEIRVTDQGTGMPPEVAAKAAEPFFTTKGPGKGTGLGLSMVAGFCRQSGGRMLIDTDVARGTTVRLMFPRSVERFPADTPAS